MTPQVTMFRPMLLPPGRFRRLPGAMQYSTVALQWLTLAVLTVEATRLQFGVALAASGFSAQNGVLRYMVPLSLTPTCIALKGMRFGFLTTIRMLPV